MKILVVEDEARIARRIERMTRDFFNDKLDQLWRVDAIDGAQEILAKQSIDLLLLDLNLNGRDGFEILHSINAASFHTIIISAYKEQAITAFEYGVLDFVPKPFNRKRLEKALMRLTQKQSKAEGLRFLAVKKRQHLRLIDLADVLYIQGADIYAQLHLRDGTTVLHNKSLDRLSQLLPPSFLRIHKSFLVPKREARELIIQAGGKYQLRLENGELLPVGRTRYKDVKSLWF